MRRRVSRNAGVSPSIGPDDEKWLVVRARMLLEKVEVDVPLAPKQWPKAEVWPPVNLRSTGLRYRTTAWRGLRLRLFGKRLHAWRGRWFRPLARTAPGLIGAVAAQVEDQDKPE